MSDVWSLPLAGVALPELALQPDISVALPDVEFGSPVPAGDPTLDKAVERLGSRIAL